MSLYYLMPHNWDDHAAWDEYFEAVREHERHLDAHELTFDIMMTLPFIQALQPGMTVWFPGCGASIGPHLCAALGFDVWASDASPVAIALQHELRAISWHDTITEPELKAQLDAVDQPGALHLFVHDFREPLPGLRVDCALNIKSFQGLPRSSMAAAARSHYEALKPRGIAFLSTVNVQGVRRDMIEDTLVEAGFVVPYYKSNQWFRAALNATGIPHIFILRQPRVTHYDPRYEDDGGQDRLQADQATLRSFIPEYQARLEAEREALQSLLATGADIRLCNVIYNTG